MKEISGITCALSAATLQKMLDGLDGVDYVDCVAPWAMRRTASPPGPASPP